MAHLHEHKHHCDSCSHEHHHEHHHDHEGHEHHHHEHSLKKQLWLILATFVLLIAAVLVEKNLNLSTWQLLLVYLVPYLLIGHETLHEALEGITHGDAFNEHFLMSVATIGALLIGFLPGAETQYPEAVFVMLFFQVGELFEGYAEGKSRDSIAHLMDIRPDIAHVETADENKTTDYADCTDSSIGDCAQPKSVKSAQSAVKIKNLSPEDVAVGSVIVVKPGEKVPLDGVVIEGTSALNTVALTGESLPRDVNVGDEVISGCVNLSGVLRVRTTKAFGESTVSKIISLVEHAGERKSQSETFITRFARVYTPIVVFAALALAVIPTLFGGNFATWLYRALMFLVVSCPCALVISVPLTFFGGIGGASRKGILVKGANYMDVLAKVDTVVFDKTGTLTHGQFAVEAVHDPSSDCSRNEEGGMRNENTSREKELLHLAAHVEHFSTHPIGAALRDAFPDEATDGCTVSDVEEVAGHGIRARVGDKIVCVGNTKMMDAIGAKWHDCHHVGTIIHVAIDGEYAGHIVINDQIKSDSAEAIAALKSLGVSRTVMLTGDRKEVADHVATTLGLSEYHAELMPADKVKYIDDLHIYDLRLNTPDADSVRSQIVNRKSVNRKSSVAFVGDGINDAPVLARADVGIAMGGLGSDAAIEAADVVLMDDKPSKIALAIRIARRTLAIARQNVVFAIGVKVAVLILAAVGIATMWLAVFADVGVTVLAVLNAMRALRA
jgi:Cd2+/Zn2+-exporting ATPase